MTKAPEGIWGIFDQFGHGSTMLRDLSQNENILTAGGNLPVKFVRADLYEAQAAEIERLRGAMAKLIVGSETVLEAWDHHMRDVVVPGSLHGAIEELRADVVEALTGSTTVKDSLTTEDEKQSHEWKCPIDYPGCKKHCGSPYGCKK